VGSDASNEQLRSILGVFAVLNVCEALMRDPDTTDDELVHAVALAGKQSFANAARAKSVNEAVLESACGAAVMVAADFRITGARRVGAELYANPRATVPVICRQVRDDLLRSIQGSAGREDTVEDVVVAVTGVAEMLTPILVASCRASRVHPLTWAATYESHVTAGAWRVRPR
jgi:hypothetical protein